MFRKLTIETDINPKNVFLIVFVFGIVFGNGKRILHINENEQMVPFF